MAAAAEISLELERVTTRMAEVVADFEKEETRQLVNYCYNKFNGVYRAMHEHHSPAYKSGSPLYFGDALPWNHFVVLVGYIAVISKLQVCNANRMHVGYLRLKRVPHIRLHVEVEPDAPGPVVALLPEEVD
jgi:hypothetical protein